MVRETTVSKTDFATYQNDVSTTFTQTNNSFNFLFENLRSEITEVNGVVNTNQNNLVKYIRFENGVIYLGMLGNEILLRETNDRISFLQNNIEVAYMSNNKLYITNAEFTNGFKFFDIEVTQEANRSITIG